MFDLVAKSKADAIVVAVSLSKKLALALVHERVIHLHVHALPKCSIDAAADVEGLYTFNVRAKMQRGCLAITGAKIARPIPRELTAEIGVAFIHSRGAKEAAAIVDGPQEVRAKAGFRSLPRVRGAACR